LKLESHYLRLHKRYNGTTQVEPLEVTMDELADILDCTHRNAVLLIRRMSDCGWVDWSPRRGRGNRSELRLLANAEEVILRMAQSLVERRDLRGAFEQLEVPSIPGAVRERFHQWLGGYFGHQSVHQGATRIDTLRFPLNGPLQTLDPLYMNYTVEAHLCSQLFDSLVRRQPGSGAIQPHIAHAWEAEQTRTCWTFYLRKGVLFHHGRELTSKDVCFTFERLQAAAHPLLYRWALDQIEEVAAIDPFTVRMRLSEPNELFLQLLCTYRSSIVPEDAVLTLGDSFGKQPAGTGPFRLVSNDGVLLVLESHHAYFRGRAHLDRVELWNMPDLYRDRDTSALQEFQILHNTRIPGDLSRRWSEARQVGMTCKFVTFKTGGGGAFANEAFRKRVYRVLQAIQWGMAYEGAEIITGTGISGVPRGMEAGPEADQAGESSMISSLDLCTITHYGEDARIVQNACLAAGIQVNITLLSPEEFRTERRLAADLLLFAIPLDEERELRMFDLFRSMLRHQTATIAGEAQRKLSAVMGEASPECRQQLFRELEEWFTHNGSLQVLYKKRLTAAYHPSVKGIPLDELSHIPFREIWFKPEEAH
jgi:SgrR family transcriptional regulator